MCTPGTYTAACSKCSVGMYSVDYQASANETCLACPAGQWSPEGSAFCEVCPSNTAAPAARGRIVDCVFNVGYTGPGGGPCVRCAAGKYKDRTGSWACTACPAYSSSELGSVSIGDCVCTSGVTGANDLPCTPCALGTYKPVPGTSVCQLWPVNMYSDYVGFSECTRCASSSASANGSESKTTQDGGHPAWQVSRS